MQREQRLFKNTVILMLGLILPRMVALINLSLTTHNISESAFGDYNIMSNIVLNLFIPLLTLSIEEGIFRYLIDSNEKKASYYISTGLAYLSFIALLALIGLSFFSFTGFGGQTRFLVAEFAAVQIIITFLRPISRGLGLNKAYSTAGILTSIINLFLTYIFVVLRGLGTEGLLLAVTLADGFGVIYLLIATKIRKLYNTAHIKLEVFIKLLKYSLPLIPNMIAWYIISLSDQLIIRGILGSAHVGIYATATKIPNILSLVYNGFSLAWTESATRSLNDQDFKKFYSKMLFNLLRVLTAGLVGLIAFSPIIFNILISNRFFEAYQYMGLLIVATFLSCISSYYGSLYIAAKAPKGISSSSIIAAIVNVVVHFALINWLGIYAAVISTVVAYIVIVAYRVVDIQKNYFKLMYYKNLNITIFLAIIISLALFHLGQFSKIAMYGNMLFSIVLAIILCLDLIIDIIKLITKKFK